jgi:trimeric autotransporter adhesin
MRRTCFWRGVVGMSLAVGLSAMSGTARAQGVTGYGVTANGSLFRFDVDSPAAVTPIGSLGIVPEAIDFRPLTAAQLASGAVPTLYAIDVGPTTTQLYTVNTQTGAVTPVGAGFPSQAAGSYSLVNQPVGFDFNPRTLAADGSIRIRVTATNGANLRLNSDTGGLTAVDTPLAFAGTGNSPFLDASAYTNNAAATDATGGTTTLFGIDTRNDVLVIQNPPNAGTLNIVGPLGATVDATAGVGFDIFTDPGSTDDTIGGDRGLAVLERPGVPPGGPLGAYLLYDVNLATGQITNGRLVGGGIDFTGGFAVIPEPGACGLLLFLTAALPRRRRSA